MNISGLGNTIDISAITTNTITNSNQNQETMNSIEKKQADRIKKQEEEKAKKREQRAKELQASMVTEEADRENYNNTKKRSNEINNVLTSVRNESVKKRKQVTESSGKTAKTNKMIKKTTTKKRNGKTTTNPINEEYDSSNKNNDTASAKENDIDMNTDISTNQGIVSTKIIAKKKTPQAPSEMALKAAKGNRAGIKQRSDNLGCEHWGVMDLFSAGKVMPNYMGHYLAKGQLLYENTCKGCNIPASQLDKKNAIQSTRYIVTCAMKDSSLGLYVTFSIVTHVWWKK